MFQNRYGQVNDMFLLTAFNVGFLDSLHENILTGGSWKIKKIQGRVASRLQLLKDREIIIVENFSKTSTVSQKTKHCQFLFACLTRS